MVILPLIARNPPEIATDTYPRFPTNIITGCIIPEKNWDFHADLYRTSLVSLNCLIRSFSLSKDFTTKCPPYVSSTCPLICPKYSCCVTKNFCDFFTTNETRNAETGRITRAIRVIRGDMLNIIINTPTSVANEVIIVVILWLSPCPKVSTSLVILDRTSP